MRKRFAIWLALGVFVVMAALVRADSPFLTANEVRPGQKGVGYTVVSGTEVKSFRVEIIGLLRSEGGERSFILVKVSGSIFRESKGIAAGMSGSPVFVSGRLVGAISYAFDRSDPQYGLVTPIEEMLRLWERESSPQKVALAPSPLLPAGARSAVPIATPLLVSGNRIPTYLTSLEGRLGMKIIAAGETFGSRKETAPPLRPGSAIAAVFALGDYSAVAIGTVTWVDGRRFLAFGHPVANRGAVDYPATGAYIHRVIANLEMPFKIGVPLSQVGRFVQDRGAGAGGFMGETADTIPVEAVVEDGASGERKTFRTTIVREPALFRPLALAALLEAIDRTLDEYTPGTAQVTLSIRAEGLGAPLVRKNLFYSDKDIAAEALAEVGEAIDLVVGNDFQELKIAAVGIEVLYTPASLVAKVVKARAERERVRPGERIRVEVELRPFRRPAIAVPFVIDLPEDLTPGRLVLTIRGGYSPPRKEEGEEGEGAGGFLGFFQTTTPGSLAEEIEAFTGRPRNNDLVLEYLPFAQEGEAVVEVKPVVLVQSCDYVIKGSTQLILEVEPPAEREVKPST